MQNYDFKDFERILIRNGYRRKRQRGSHAIYKNESTGDLISITNKITGVNACIGRKLIKDHKLVVE